MGRLSLGLDIGSNSVGSALVDHKTGEITVGISVFPAGVDESDDKRGEPKNAKRRATRRTRITLARRASRKRLLRLKLIDVGLLPTSEEQFKKLLEDTDPWELRRKGLFEALLPHEFGRVLLHLAQRRGALGFDADLGDTGKVKTAIVDLQLQMLDKFGAEDSQVSGRELRKSIETLSKKKRTEIEDLELEKAQEKLKLLCQALLDDGRVTVGRFVADLRDDRRTQITTPDKRKLNKGAREWRRAVRNKGGNFEFHADRGMIRDEFAKLWAAQSKLGEELSQKLTEELRLALDDESRNSDWRHKGLLFGQRMQSWDLGTLGRCVLEPTERCAPHADMYASQYLIVETVNNLKIIERGKVGRSLKSDERNKIKTYLSGPLGTQTKGKQKGLPKKTVSVADLRELMGWGPARKDSHFHFNIESDEDRVINTDWFSREIIHGAISPEKWSVMSERSREGINRAVLKYDPDDENQSEKLKSLVMQEWAGLSSKQADALVAAWKKRPRPDAKRLSMSRHAVRNLLVYMDHEKPWPDPAHPVLDRWLTQIEARKKIAKDKEFVDVITGKPLDELAKTRYATGAKGATAKDRHYMRKHILKKNGELVYGADGLPLHAPPPAPLISNPVVRKAVHEVKRHLVNYMISLGLKPDEVYVELAREAKMGKVNADKMLFKNRLRNRIRNDIAHEFNLDSVSSTQRRAAVDRVILAVQQGCTCALCGQGMYEGKCDGITLRTAAMGQGCEVAHILPKACGGHNGLGNIVLAHTKCNRDMGRRTPRDFWNSILGEGFEEGLARVEKIYTGVERPKPSDIKNASGNALWVCYFTEREANAKIEQFKKDIKDIAGMTPSQLAATTYAARQIMTYLADALFDGKGLPERGGDRLIFASDGMWTSRFRREWGLFFDEHNTKAKGLSNAQEHERKEKNRGDHRHHAIDAIVIALSSDSMRKAWDERELQADKAGINTANEEEMESYRRTNPLPLPKPYSSREEFREAVKRAVYGTGEVDRPICHRPVKRKLMGAFHKATQYGAVVDQWQRDGEVCNELVKERVTVRQDILGEAPTDFLKPAHLRLPRPETNDEAVDRLARRLRIGKKGLQQDEAIKAARKIVKSKAFVAAIVDPKPEKGGIVRDTGLRYVLRRRLEERGLNPDSYSKSELKKSIDEYGPLAQDSGVPIFSVVLLWSNSDPVTIQRNHYEYSSGKQKKATDLKSLRLYDGQNNHHIEIRVKSKNNVEVWTGTVVTAYEVAQKKLDRLRAMRDAGVPSAKAIRRLSKAERERYRSIVREIEQTYGLVDRLDSDEKGGQFVMSLCEGEIILMQHKRTKVVDYFVVAEIVKNKRQFVLVPHWDARRATKRKDAEGKEVADSMRDEFAATPSDLRNLAPPGYDHAVKVRVSPLGEFVVTHKD